MWNRDDNNIIIDNYKIEDDKLIDGDERTAKIMNEVANSINPDIIMSYDVISNKVNKRLPYLDTEMWIEYNNPDYPWGKIRHCY